MLHPGTPTLQGRSALTPCNPLAQHRAVGLGHGFAAGAFWGSGLQDPWVPWCNPARPRSLPVLWVQGSSQPRSGVHGALRLWGVPLSEVGAALMEGEE